MFEGSIFTSPEPHCHDHPKQLVSQICMDIGCKQNPFMCVECASSSASKQRHYGHDLKIKPFGKALQQISATFSASKKPIQNLYKTLLNSSLGNNMPKNGNSCLNSSLSASNPPTLIKYQQQKQQHCQSIRKHIQSIKYSLSQELKSLQASFQKCLEQELDYVHKELEKYYDNYRQYFQHFCYKIAPVVLINRQLKYYDSKQNIALKIMAQIDYQQRNKWFSEVKKAVYAANKVLIDYQGQFSKLQTISTKTNQMMDLLPRTCGPQNQSLIRKIMNNAAKDIFRSVIKFGETAYYYKDTRENYSNKSIDTPKAEQHKVLSNGGQAGLSSKGFLQRSHSMQVDNNNGHQAHHNATRNYDYPKNT